MYEQESAILAEAFISMHACCSRANISAFLRACWLLPENCDLSFASFERLIYVDGDQQEIYTSRERQFIKAHKRDVYSCSFPVSTKSGIVNSRMIAIDLGYSHRPVFEAIAIMKILNKALDGFNVFCFISDSGAYLGCAGLRANGDTIDCIISPPITCSMDWDLLANLFLYREDSESFYQYYHGLVNVFRAIGYCYKAPERPLYVWESYGYSDEDFPYPPCRKRRSIWDNYSLGIENVEEAIEEDIFDVTAFEDEIVECMIELDYIVSSRANSLELLFEAEEALTQAERQEEIANTAQPVDTEDDLSDIALLDDPIALMKKLKRDHGL